MAPCLKQFLFQSNFGDAVLGSSVDQVANGQLLAVLASGDLEVANLAAHGLGSTGTPVRVVVGVVVLGGFLVKELDDHPAQGVLLGCEGAPLFDNQELALVRVRLASKIEVKNEHAGC